MTRVWQPAGLASLLAALLLAGRAQTVVPPPLDELPPERFLEEIRRPFQQHAWGELTGRLTHAQDDNLVRGHIHIRLSLAPAAIRAQIVLNDSNVYAFEQRHVEGQMPQTTLTRPENEVAPSLFAFGVEPEDVTFSFIYWTFTREHPRESFRRHPCRVMELADPNSDGHVLVWFSATRGFPLRAQWFKPGVDKPWRELELKGARKHTDDLWFVKEMRIEGEGWKTRVRFDHAELNPVTAVPAEADQP